MNGEDQGPLGKTRKVNTSAITALLDDDMLVIVPPIGYSLTGETFVLNCKALAGQVAEALSADKLIYFLRPTVFKMKLASASVNCPKHKP